MWLRVLAGVCSLDLLAPGSFEKHLFADSAGDGEDGGGEGEGGVGLAVRVLERVVAGGSGGEQAGTGKGDGCGGLAPLLTRLFR